MNKANPVTQPAINNLHWTTLKHLWNMDWNVLWWELQKIYIIKMCVSVLCVFLCVLVSSAGRFHHPWSLVYDVPPSALYWSYSTSCQLHLYCASADGQTDRHADRQTDRQTDRQADSIDFNSIYLQEVSWMHSLRLCELLNRNVIFHLRINSPTPIFYDTSWLLLTAFTSNSFENILLKRWYISVSIT